MSNSASIPTVGSGAFSFRPQVNWAQLPEGWAFREIAGVDVDSQDRVYVFCRSASPVPPLMVFDRDGQLLDSWGDGKFERPHGVAVAPDGSVFLIDDWGHAVYKFTPQGELLMTLGTPGKESDTGVKNKDYRTQTQLAGPFNMPTNVAFSPEGDIYVSDGYGNARVHRFSADGELLASWGELGSGPGQFELPHGVAIDGNGKVFISDRENTRIQIFTPNGEFLDEWTDVARPCEATFDKDGNLYTAEVGFEIGMFVGKTFPGYELVPARVSIFSPNHELLARWGSGDYGRPGEFFGNHDIAVDSRGDVYVGEVRPGVYGWDETPPPGPKAPPESPVLQKFIRI